MSHPQIKVEPEATPTIKEEPDTKDGVGGILSDEDIYEDTGDFDLSGSGKNVWLTRIPRDLWENWAALDDDEEIQIGTIRVEGPADDVKRVCFTFAVSEPMVLRRLFKTYSSFCF